jgi:LysR family tdc operon transcriptional activator
VGSIFHSHVLSYVNGLKKSISELKMEFGKNCQSFSLGYSSLVGYTILPDIISEFKMIHKDISLNIYEGQLSSLLPLVNSGAIDCAIGTISDNGSVSECYAEKLFQSQFSVFSSPLHPLARAKNFAQLTSAKWVLPETQFGYYYKLNDFLADNGIDIRSAIRTDSISSILNLVTCANYLTILASPMGEGRNKKLALHKIAIQETLPTADYYFVWSKKFIPSILLERFMAIIKERCAISLWGA